MGIKRLSHAALERLGAPSGPFIVTPGSGAPTLVQKAVTPVQQVTKLFILQSYFDTTLLNKALLSQPQGTNIVASTSKEEQVSESWALGLHPSSQCPVAVEFKVLGSQTIALKPGEVIYPGASFKSFTWGLPYGWLGGGLAHLVAFKSKETVLWHGNPEILFHRLRVKVNQPSDLTAGTTNNAPNNWPTRFPWTQAVQGSTSTPQQGAPVLSISEQTRTLCALFNSTLVAQAAQAGGNLRFIYQGTQDFELTSTGTQGLTSPVFEDINFPGWTPVGASGNLSLQRPVQALSGLAMNVVHGDDGGLVIVDLNGNFVGGNWFVDICRYGRL